MRLAGQATGDRRRTPPRVLDSKPPRERIGAAA